MQPTTTLAGALFAFEEVGTGSLKGQFGLRYEGQSVESDDPTLRDRDFSAPSASAGLVWNNGAYAVASTLSYSSRVPTAEELYANGPHIATFSFEVGDDDLDLEKSAGPRHRHSGRSRGGSEGEVSFFYTHFYGLHLRAGHGDDVHHRRRGRAADHPVHLRERRSSTAARPTWTSGCLHADPHHLDLELKGDYVHAELTDLNEPVPLQPPAARHRWA